MRAAGLAGALLACHETQTEQDLEGVARGIESWARRWLEQALSDFGPNLLGASPYPL
jgi:hypothetical protein